MTNEPDLTLELLEALAWQLELGADEAIGDAPLDRFAESAASAAVPIVATPAVRRAPDGATGTTADAPRRPEGPQAAEGQTEGQSPHALARAAATLEELAEAMRSFEGSPLKKSARSFVFCDGLAGARVMVIGEAPGGEEDRIGKPFVGRAGQLLDRMLAAIGLDRTTAYIANVIPWRPPGNRTPSPQETEICRPFITRQIELADPNILVLLGGAAAKTLVETSEGIMRMRGKWRDYDTGSRKIRAMATLHPAYLLRQPLAKKLAWRDFLAIKAALDGG